MTTDRACVRCGRTEDLERHHIKPRYAGGGDEEGNLEDQCVACHDYEHARRNVVDSLSRARSSRFIHESREKDKLWRLAFRLAVLDALNPPEVVRQRGTYIGYWVVEDTHDLPEPGTGQAEYDYVDESKQRGIVL